MYEAPPIQEAVIGVVFKQPIVDKIPKLIRSLEKRYEIHEADLVAQVPTAPNQGEIAATPFYRREKFSSLNLTEIIAVMPNMFSVSKLPPYTHWAEFLNLFKEEWESCRKICGVTPIERLGVRYVNRIDIPAKTSKLNLNAYFKYRITTLPNLDLSGFSHGAVYQTTSKYAVLINSSLAQPALIEHHSVMLDIDVSQSKNLPQKTDALIDLLNEMRDIKNEVFEACITEKTRKLFGK